MDTNMAMEPVDQDTNIEVIGRFVEALQLGEPELMAELSMEPVGGPLPCVGAPEALDKINEVSRTASMARFLSLLTSSQRSKAKVVMKWNC